MLIAVTNFPSGRTVQYRITDSTGSTLQAWTATGVTELVVSSIQGVSTYYVDTLLITSGAEVMIDWRTQSEDYIATDVVNTMRSNIDASVDAVKVQTDRLTFDANDSVRNRSVFPTGSVVTNVSNTALAFKTNLSSGVDNFYAGNHLLFTSGALNGQRRKITAYDQATKFISLLSSLTDVPAGSDTFDIVNY